MDLLAELGDDGVRTRVAGLCEAVAEALPQAFALAIWFTDEDLTLLHHTTPGPDDTLGASPRTPRSSLALRFATGTRIIAVVTVYSSLADTFRGRVDAVERRLGSVRGASVLDDDLDMASWRRAELAPAQLQSRVLVDTALGMLMGAVGLSLDAAEAWLHDVARTSGRTVLAVAGQVVAAHDADVDGVSAPDLDPWE